MKRATDPRAAARARARGFTLIEMLVAIALLAVIALLSWRGLDATIRGRDDIASNLAQTRLLGRYFSQLQFDLTNLVTPDEVFGPPLRIRPGELVMVRHLGVGGGPTQMQVVRYQLRGGKPCAARRSRSRRSPRWTTRCITWMHSRAWWSQ